MWEMRLTELMTSYSWPLISTRVHSSHNFRFEKRLHDYPSVALCFSSRRLVTNTC
jgi:hypothetical protein